ncbi:MAG: type III secretion system export apparatus subunit SctT [Kiloniellales bacterium]|nr:type III secretion system export apparatus subunit SctT [Kiloniellales bacterium]
MLSSGVAQVFLETIIPFISAAGLAMARGLGLILVFPAFTRLGLSGLLRSGVALCLSLPLVPYVMVQFDVIEPLGHGRLALLIVKELLLGVVLGLAFGLPFWSVEAAGDLLDFYRGSSMAFLIDPSATTETSILGTLFSLILVALFFVIGGFELIIEGLYRSYAVWPVVDLVPSLQDGTADFFLQLLDSIFRLGMIFAGPLLIAMFLGELALALMNRFAPSLNVFDLSLSIKNLILALGMPVYAIFALEYFKGDLASLRGVTGTLELFAR